MGKGNTNDPTKIEESQDHDDVFMGTTTVAIIPPPFAADAVTATGRGTAIAKEDMIETMEDGFDYYIHRWMIDNLQHEKEDEDDDRPADLMKQNMELEEEEEKKKEVITMADIVNEIIETFVVRGNSDTRVRQEEFPYYF